MINSYFVIKKDGKTLQHFLPLLFGIYFIIISILGLFYERHFIIKILFYLSNILPLAMLYIFIFTNVISSNKKTLGTDYIIVLGCKINAYGKPMRVLRSRLKLAIKKYESLDVKPYIIVCGGKGNDEPISEGQSMKEYLINEGIPSKMILVDDKSLSTYENLLYAKNIIEKRQKNYKVTIVSSRYHLLRVSEIVKSLNMKASLLGSKTTLVYYPCALCREVVAFLLNNILICILYCIFVIALLFMC